MAERAAEGGWHVHRVASHNEAAVVVGETARLLKARRVARSTEEIFRRVDVDRALRGGRINPLVLATGRQRRRSELASLGLEADLGITGVEFAIAETGSCVVVSRKGVARITSLAPRAYIALVEAEQVLGNLEELMAMRRLEHMSYRARMPNYFTLISGPSRTADIDFTMATGVHRAGEVHHVLIG